VGITFLTVGIAKLTGTGNTVEYFAAIGWGQWFRFATAVCDLAGATLLFVPRWTCYGAMLLTATVGMATLISITRLQGDPAWGGSEMVAVPFVLTGLAALLAWLTRPGRLTPLDRARSN
jgi:hypothetical protein